MTFFEMSFQQWALSQTGKAPEDITKKRLKAETVALLEAWRQVARLEWAAIKSRPHYHGGWPCVHEPGCPRYQRPAEAAAE